MANTVPSASRGPKRFKSGTHRVLTPEETLERVRRVMPAMGITRIANVTGLDRIGIPVVMVCRPGSRALSVSQGKGLDLAAAKVSGLMESVEMFHAERIRAPLKLGSFNDLCFSQRLIDVARLPRLSVSAYHEDLRLLWAEGRELWTDEPMWLPFELVHMDHTLPLPSGSGSFFMSSSGLASGNHLLEAISHGICELVEHDATTLWHCLDEEGRRRTRVDLGSVDDAACRELLERYERSGIAVAVWETTTDIGIPSFLCVIRERDPDPLGVLSPAAGMGCHPAKEVALLRALTEAAQSRLTLISGSREDLVLHTYPGGQEAESGRRPATWGGEDAVVPRSFRDVPTFEGDLLQEDVTWELERLRGAGMDQVVLVELTRPEVGLPVVRVVVPGLEAVHDAPGYVPGARARGVRRAEA